MTAGLQLAAVVLGGLIAGLASAWCASRYGVGPRLGALVTVAAPVTALVVLRELPSPLAPWGWALGWILLTLAVVDAAALRLPDVFTLPLAGLGLAEAWALGADAGQRALGLVAGLAAFSLLAWFYARLRGRAGLGGGDVKLLGAAGAWVGWQALPMLVLSACVLAGLGLAARALAQGAASLRQPFPFGIALAAATGLVWLAQGAGLFVA